MKKYNLSKIMKRAADLSATGRKRENHGRIKRTQKIYEYDAERIGRKIWNQPTADTKVRVWRVRYKQNDAQKCNRTGRCTGMRCERIVVRYSPQRVNLRGDFIKSFLQVLDTEDPSLSYTKVLLDPTCTLAYHARNLLCRFPAESSFHPDAPKL